MIPETLVEELFVLARRCPPHDYRTFLAAIRSGKISHAAILTRGHIPRTLNCYIIFRMALWSFRDLLKEFIPSNQRIGLGNYFSHLASHFWRQLKSLGGVIHGENVEQLCRDVAAFAAAEHRKLHPNYEYQPRRNVKIKSTTLRSAPNLQTMTSNAVSSYLITLWIDSKLWASYTGDAPEVRT